MSEPARVDELTAVLALLEPDLGPLRGEPQTLSGGMTNRNVRVLLGDGDYVVRLCGMNADVVSVDRESEMLAQRAAHAAGIAPAVAARLTAGTSLGDPAGEVLACDVLVTEFALGPTLSAADVRAPEMLARIARSLRTLHAGPMLPAVFPTFELAEDYARRAGERGALVDGSDRELATGLSGRIRGALRGPDHEPVPCHNDLLPANFLGDAQRVEIIDWEYAGMNDRFFDLGNLAVNSELSEDEELVLLRSYFGEEPDARRVAALRLMRLMSDVREALWGVVQSVFSEVEFDYEAYGREHFARLRAAAADPRLQDWLRAASA